MELSAQAGSTVSLLHRNQLHVTAVARCPRRPHQTTNLVDDCSLCIGCYSFFRPSQRVYCVIIKSSRPGESVSALQYIISSVPLVPKSVGALQDPDLLNTRQALKDRNILQQLLRRNAVTVHGTIEASTQPASPSVLPLHDKPRSQ